MDINNYDKVSDDQVINLANRNYHEMRYNLYKVEEQRKVEYTKAQTERTRKMKERKKRIATILLVTHLAAGSVGFAVGAVSGDKLNEMASNQPGTVETGGTLIDYFADMGDRINARGEFENYLLSKEGSDRKATGDQEYLMEGFVDYLEENNRADIIEYLEANPDFLGKGKSVK